MEKSLLTQKCLTCMKVYYIFPQITEVRDYVSTDVFRKVQFFAQNLSNKFNFINLRPYFNI